MQNQTNFGNSNNTQWGMNNEQSQTYNPLGNSNSTINSGLNNSSLFSPNNMQGLNLNASAALSPQQNSFSTYSQPYQLAQNSLPNSASDVGNIEDREKLEDNKLNTYVGYSRYNHDCSVQGVFDNFLKMRKDTAVEKPISSDIPAADYALNRIPIIGKYIKAYNLSSQACSTLAQALNAYHESCQTINKK